ncbi:hypothetical protein EDB19DRAFT_1899249 [Suillus lakei]|nr:hypothetical protein EDB19DRAFT_1899249 [Suillus lakei]
MPMTSRYGIIDERSMSKVIQLIDNIKCQYRRLRNKLTASLALYKRVNSAGVSCSVSLQSKVSSASILATIPAANFFQAHYVIGPLVLVFEYDLTHPPNKSTIPLSPNSLRKLRTIRHPDVLKFIDDFSQNCSFHLRQILLTFRVRLRIAFLNDSASSNHGNVHPNAIFITPSGDWNNLEGGLSVIYTMGGLMPDAMACTPQKSKRFGLPSKTTDRYTLGLLIHTVFNPTHPPPPTAQPPHPSQVFCRGAIPTSVLPSFKKLNPNHEYIGMAESDGESHEFFVNNQLIKVWAGLDGFTLSMTWMCSMLEESDSSFPPKFVSYRCRGTRIVLLDSLPDFTEKLDKKTVVNMIWPNLQTGFTDTVAVIRKATVRAIVLLSPKLSDRIPNNDLLRHLARLQSDPKASIRTNTYIPIGWLGPSPGYNTKRKVLVPAFSMALRDSFVHACVAGVMAFMATAECFGMEGVASKVVSAVVSATLDKEDCRAFVKRLEAHTATMPETTSTEEGGEDLPARLPGAFTQAGLVNSATGAASALTGWAVSSLRCTAQLAPADMQTTISITIDGSTLAPNLNGRASPLPLSSASPSVNPSRSKGLQLGGNKAPTSTLTAQLANEAGQGSSRLWNDDLIDIHADEGDWNLTHTPHNPADPLHLPLSYQHFPPASSARSTPVSSPRPLPNAADNAPSTSMAGMSKEEKAAEMARRKEERRLGIEKLKEQKKNAAAAGKV